MRHVVVFGGQYGSEGKASAAEFLAKKLRAEYPGLHLTVIGENGPNSGHTSTQGSTRSIPASSFWADSILMGPDSVIELELLQRDWRAVKKPIYIHEHAAVLMPEMKADESDLVRRISSTGSGTGMARAGKFIHRRVESVIEHDFFSLNQDIVVVDNEAYFNLISHISSNLAIFECSQGLLLDTNFGLFPHVTSRSTLPRVAVERNGLGGLDWSYYGVFRTYPIRTGGPSGPCAGKELTWASLGVKPEITTVTKRVRRVFEFSTGEFMRSLQLARPDGLMFTFLDYLGLTNLDQNDLDNFLEWVDFHRLTPYAKRLDMFVSCQTGNFVHLQ